jgi:hypothetical protein
MTFGPEFYVPVLKIKKGEKEALPLLSPRVQSLMLPLFEVVERKPRPKKDTKGSKMVRTSLATHLKNQFNGLGAAVAPFPRFFLDCRELESDGPEAVSSAFALAAQLGTPVTPVTGISRTLEMPAVMSSRNHGVAIRLTVSEFEEGRIPKGLPNFLNANALKPEDVDLIVDLGGVDKMVSAGVAELAASFLPDVPDLRRWRTLTVSGSAFPKSMGLGTVETRSSSLVPRAEWLAWNQAFYSRRDHLDRLPTFSDCAIQHPDGVEGFNPATMSVSASIRITQSDDWLLVKGVSTDDIPAAVQFPQLATRLVYGELKPYFHGAKHCTGCKQMLDAANGEPGLGTPIVWRKLGTIHHITRAVEMISDLPWP